MKRNKCALFLTSILRAITSAKDPKKLCIVAKHYCPFKSRKSQFYKHVLPRFPKPFINLTPEREPPQGEQYIFPLSADARTHRLVEWRAYQKTLRMPTRLAKIVFRKNCAHRKRNCVNNGISLWVLHRKDFGKHP